MKHLFSSFLLTLVLVTLAIPLQAGQEIHHEIKITLRPEEHRLQVEDTITLPETFFSPSGGKYHFLLHGGLQPTSPNDRVRIVREKGKPQPSHFGLPASLFLLDERVPSEHYSVSLPPEERTFVLTYQGQINHPLQDQGEEYARSFSETPGIISTDGIFMAGSTLWYPWFNNDLVTFTLDVQLPQGWEAVSQGERTRHRHEGDTVHVRWESPEPQDEIYLAAGPLTEYSRAAGGVMAMAFLRTADKELADPYLEATTQYLEMYRKLIGPYPYKKFVLVENFWETGYGMPSFTLLGPNIIRLPFILHSSYPHEILHNWWGNGVFVDLQTGNWSEGLTAYLADHLISEQRGAGLEARRASLQKYTDYVSEGKDFPLTEFRSRYSSVTEAVGYGKTMMFFHMLRQQLGDERFIQALQRFYLENKFKRAGFSELQSAFSHAAGKDLQTEFSQWITRAGAPALRVSNVRARPDEEGTLLTAILEQAQPGETYLLHVPVAITLKDQEKAFQTTVFMEGKRLELALHLPAPPLRLDVDPEFDLFRRLDRNEIPPALTQAFGADEVLIILPSGATEKLRQGYRQLAESWQQSQSGQIEMKWDSEINELPSDRAVWLLGWENRFQNKIMAALADYEMSITSASTRIGKTEIPHRNHSLVLVARNASNPDLALAWVATDNVAALPGLGRKLPHYGRYSYLGFKGDEPTNVAKGEWPVIHSPMSVSIPQPDGLISKASRGGLTPRQALATLPPAFSEERMVRDIRFLASDDLQGRGFGTAELDRAADFIAEEFRKAGLKPAGDLEGSYFQVWKEPDGEMEREVVLKNVVGVLPGRNPAWAGQSVVVGAHYDHLGLGWPGVRSGDEGKIHYGADDNASGVAVLLELARVLGKRGGLERTVVFVTFSGEEAGLRGSRYYVASEKRFPADKIIGMLNMDTVGRLGERKLLILGAGSAREWIHIFMGASFVTGVPVEVVAHDFGTSDQKSFQDAGVPAVQFFSGTHLDFHRPTDTADKIDPSGLVKGAAVVKEAIEYLASRPEPLISLLTPRGEAPEGPVIPVPGRRASLGTVPDFAYTGQGFRISGVVPGSPVEEAGLQAGDIIVHIDATPIGDLRAFTDVLKMLEPGESVSITYIREGQEQTVQVIAEGR